MQMTNKPLSQAKVLTESNIQLPRPSDPLFSTFLLSLYISLNPEQFPLCSGSLLDFQSHAEENQMKMRSKPAWDQQIKRDNIHSSRILFFLLCK